MDHSLQENAFDLGNHLLVAVSAGKEGLVGAFYHWDVAGLLATHALHLHHDHAQQRSPFDPTLSLLPSPPLLYETSFLSSCLWLHARHLYPAEAEGRGDGLVGENTGVGYAYLVKGYIMD